MAKSLRRIRQIAYDKARDRAWLEGMAAIDKRISDTDGQEIARRYREKLERLYDAHKRREQAIDLAGFLTNAGIKNISVGAML